MTGFAYWVFARGIPIIWIVAGLAVLHFANPVLKRFMDIADQAYIRSLAEPTEKNRRVARLTLRDYRTRRLIAAVPCIFIIIGVLVITPLPMPIDRILVTILFFSSSWVIGYKFYAENRDQSWEERLIEHELEERGVDHG